MRALIETGLLERTDELLARGERDVALTLCLEARSQFPETPWPWLRSAEIMIELRRFSDAESILEQGVNRFPNEFWLARARALLPRAVGDDVELFTRSRALRHAFPDNRTAQTTFVHMLLDLQLVALAEGEAQAGLARFPEYEWMQHMYARCADQAGDRSAAAARWTDLLSAHPEHEPAYAAAVHALLEIGRVDEAVGLAREGLRLFPTGSAARKAADEVANVTISADPVPASTASLEDLLSQALIAEHKGRWRDGARLWTLLRERVPGFAPAHAGSARALLKLGRVAEAAIVLCQARRDLPPEASVLEASGDVALHRGAFEAALDSYGERQRRFAPSPHAAQGIARALHALQRLVEADAAYVRLRENQPSDLPLAQQYAAIAAERGDWREAASRWAEITADFPDYVPGYWRWADALLEAGGPAEADAVLTEAVARFPDDLETAVRWARSGRQVLSPADSTARWDRIGRHFPSMAALA
jgi:tetratricopeptide (TPR) repeat protein